MKILQGMTDENDLVSSSTTRQTPNFSSSRDEPQTNDGKVPTKSDYLLILLTILLKFGDSIEIYLPGVITQTVSCELSVSDMEEKVLAVIFYLSFSVTTLISAPISSRLGERLTLIISLYLSIVFAIICAVVPNYYTLLLSRTLTGICVGLNGCTSGIFLAKFGSSTEIVSKGSFLAEALAMPVGATWVSVLGWLLLGQGLVDWRVFILLTSLPLFVPPLLILHLFFNEKHMTQRENAADAQPRKENDVVPTENDKLIDVKEIPNFTARVFRASLFLFSNFCLGYATIILVPWLIRSNKVASHLNGGFKSKCDYVVQGDDFLILTMVTGVPNIIGALLGYALWGRVKFLVLQITITIIMALSFGIILFKPGFAVSMALLALSKLSYSMQGAELAILHFDRDYFGEQRFELGSCLTGAAANMGGLIGTSLAAFLDPHYTISIFLVVALGEIVTICFMRERF